MTIRLSTASLFTVANLLVLNLLCIAQDSGSNAPPAASWSETSVDPEALALLAGMGRRENVPVHDPSTIARCKDQYWMFATGMGVDSWHSTNLLDWKRGARVFDGIPAWRTNAVPGNRGHLWAPDVIFHNGRYLLYYSVSTFGKNTSAIALVTNPTLDPSDPNCAWTDRGPVIRSSPKDDFNAIDPAVTVDADSRLWMSFGSFWGGIKMIELDPATGLRLAPDSEVYALAHYESIEAPFIYRHGDYYYLFVNWGMCCRGLRSTYNMRVGRSKEITGPYFDKEGVNMLSGGGSLVMDTEGPFIGPGHAGVLKEGEVYWISCHFYDGTTRRGTSRYAIRPLTWDAQGWPVAGEHPAK